MATGATETVKNYEYLYTKYSHLFTDGEKEPVSMFGFECGNGWYKILENLIDHIDRYIHHKYKRQGTEFYFKITQIKEKFGGLRFYYDGGDDAIFELVRYVENQSYHTCEFCGTNQEIMRSQGWVITACKPCATTHENLKHRNWIKVLD